jgi:hypothetical protein
MQGDWDWRVRFPNVKIGDLAFLGQHKLDRVDVAELVLLLELRKPLAISFALE